MNSFKKIFFSFISLLVFGAVIILGVVLFPSPGFSHPVINWMPGRATETVAQGGNKATVVSFVSRKDLTNVSVWVVPELQPYISANPSYFSSINAGDLNIITLNISAPLTPPLETESLDGTIHLRNNAGNKTYSNPLPLILTIEKGWVTLNNPILPYSLQYPDTWTATIMENTDMVDMIGQVTPTVPIKPGDMGGVCKISSGSFENPDLLSLADWLKQAEEETGALPPLSSVPIIIDGMQGIKEIIEEIALTTTVYLPIGNNILSFELICGDEALNKGEEIFSYILESIILK